MTSSTVGVRVAAAVAGCAALLSACGGNTSLRRESLAELRQVAVVVHVAAGPTVRLPSVVDGDPGAPAVDPRELVTKLRDSVPRAEVREFLRTSFAGFLERSGGLRVADPVKVASALAAYLVEEDPSVRDYGGLERLGIDGVFELTLNDFGITESDEPPPLHHGWYIDVTGQLLRLSDREILWRRQATHDGAESGKYPCDVDAVAANPGDEFRDGFGRLIDRGAQVLFSDLKIGAGATVSEE